MKKGVIIITLFFCNFLYGQIETANDFIEFGQMSDQNKHSFMFNKGWIGINTNQFVEDNKIFSDMNYWKMYNNDKYLLLIRNISEINKGENYTVTTVTINSLSVFNLWFEEIKASYSLIKSEDDKWSITDEGNFVLTIEKRKIKDIYVYVFSLID